MYVPNYISLLVEIILHAFTFEICTEPGLPKEYSVTKIIVLTLFCRKCIAKYIEVKSPGQQYSKYKMPWIGMWTPFGPCLLQAYHHLSSFVCEMV